jgi:hypothetical protein
LHVARNWPGGVQRAWRRVGRSRDRESQGPTKVFQDTRKFFLSLQLFICPLTLVIGLVDVHTQLLHKALRDLRVLADEQTSFAIFVHKINIDIEFLHKGSEEIDMTIGSGGVE